MTDEPGHGPSGPPPPDDADAREPGDAPPPGSAGDAPAAQPDPEPVDAAPSRRRWPRRLAAAGAVGLLGVAGALGWLAWDNASHAEDWEAVADHTQGELDATRSDLAAAEAEVATLETRVAELAAEKAQIATERGLLRSQGELLTQITSRANETIAALAACLPAQQATTVAALELEPGSADFDAQVANFRAAADRADSLCQAAVAAVDGFQDSLDALAAAQRG